MPEVELSLAEVLQIAVQHHQAGNAPATQYLCRQILSADPRQADALHLLGVSLLRSGDSDAAVRTIELALSIDPAFAAAYRSLGEALTTAGRATDAVRSYRQCLLLNPSDADAHSKLAALLIAQGQLDEAEALCWRAIELSPQNVQYQLDLGNLHRQRGQTAQAIFVYSQIINASPAFAPAYAARAAILAEHALYDEALEDHRRALELSPTDHTMRLEMASTLGAVGDVAGARRCCEQVLQADPQSVQAWETLGRVLQTNGRFDEAAAAFEAALRITPKASVALRLGMMRQRRTPEQIVELSQVLTESAASVEERVAAGFALGRLLDESDRFEDAFAAYAQANALWRDSAARCGFRFDFPQLCGQVEQIINSFTPQFFQQRLGWGSESQVPVFIVGMPRSGTTLVEQIAASHSQVMGCGERFDISMIRSRLDSQNPTGGSSAWERATVEGEAAAHLQHLQKIGRGAQRVIDKMPANLMEAGLIATLFPRARIIFCRRDARDTCLSCFFQRFAGNGQMFSYDLADCGRQYNQFDRLLHHWQRVLPLASLVVEYEQLVGDLEGQSRRLIDFLGLEWEPGCLAFHQSDRPVLTSSFWQVRQPIYTRSVGRWKHYQRHLSPLMAVLQESSSADRRGERPKG